MARARVVKVDRKYGKPYEVRWSWTESGKRHHRTQPCATRAEADALADDLNVQLRRGYVPNLADGKRQFRTYSEEWLASLVDIRPRTRLAYEQALRNHIWPVFGERALVDMRRADCEDFVRVLSSKRLVPKSIKETYAVLARVLDRAVAADALAKNPARGVPLPTDRSTGRTKPEPAFLTPEQVEALAVALDDQPPYGLLIRFMAYSGLRCGEVAGLNVGDVHPGRIHVHRTRERVHGGWREGLPKSEQSTRFVPIPPWLRTELTRYLARDHPHGADLSAPLWPGRHRYPDLLKFGLLDWSEPWERDCFYKRVFKPALAAAALPSRVRLHDLRHTYASICASAGIPPYRVAQYMGHANVTTTLTIYTHLFAADASADMALLDRPMQGQVTVARLAPR